LQQCLLGPELDEKMPTSSPDQASCYAVAAILLVFSTVAVGGRLFVRRMKRAPIGVDDISISLSLVSVGHILCCRRLLARPQTNHSAI
jgi:hypothetical protein